MACEVCGKQWRCVDMDEAFVLCEAEHVECAIQLVRLQALR